MDVDAFWELVDRSARETGNRQERLDWLEDHLSRLSAEEIVDYYAWFTTSANRACSWDMYAVCWLITGSGSSDGFEYFVSWLISTGREAFEKVADCPDRIVELPEVQRIFELSRTFRHERTVTSGDFRVRHVTRTRRHVWPPEDYPEFELFAYVAHDPYEQVMGEETAHVGDAVRARGIDGKFPFLTYNARPDDEEWDFGDRAEITRRLPRLADHYELAEEPDEQEGRRYRGWPRGVWEQERARAWTFHRKGGTVTWVRDLRHLRCIFGIEKVCSWPARDTCSCARSAW